MVPKNRSKMPFYLWNEFVHWTTDLDPEMVSRLDCTVRSTPGPDSFKITMGLFKT